MSTIRRMVTIAAAGTVLAIAGAGQALAVDGSGPDYADHVRGCQQHTGFDGTHNPGVLHQGYSGWDPNHTC